MSKEIYIIEDLVPVEVSEVEEPAIGEYFYFIKGDGNMEKYLTEEYLAIIEKKLGKEQAEAIKNALEILAPIFKDAPEDVRKAIAILAEAVGYGYPEPVEKNDMSKLDTVISLVEKLSEELGKLKQDILTEVKKQDGEQEQEKKESVRTDALESELLQELTEIIAKLRERNEELNAIISGILNQ